MYKLFISHFTWLPSEPAACFIIVQFTKAEQSLNCDKVFLSLYYSVLSIEQPLKYAHIVICIGVWGGNIIIEALWRGCRWPSENTWLSTVIDWRWEIPTGLAPLQRNCWDLVCRLSESHQLSGSHSPKMLKNFLQKECLINSTSYWPARNLIGFASTTSTQRINTSKILALK